jgi:hypothetical protein
VLPPSYPPDKRLGTPGSEKQFPRSLSDLDDFEQNVLEFSHNPPSDAGVYWNIRQSGGWIWANSKTIVAGSGKSDRLLALEGERNFSSAFLPAIHQGTAIQHVGSSPDKAPIRNLTDRSLSKQAQRRRIDLIQSMNRRQLDRLQADQQMEGVIESFELAFKMQTETPKLIDFNSESKATQELYGIGHKTTDQFGRQCLLARRFAEAGVRFVQVTLDGWDHHSKIASGLKSLCAKADKPIAGLLTDLKSRGLLDDTLVLWGGEFGRTPHAQNGDGREHNQHGFTMCMAGGGDKGGITHGTTDDFGYYGVDGKVHINDLHATMLHLMGMDHERLTFDHHGRPFRLTDVAGNVVNEIIA